MHRSLLVKNAKLVDGRGGQPVENAAVAVSDGLITKVGKASDIQPPDGALIIEAHGKTVMPGLIEPHAHLGFIEWPSRLAGLLAMDVAFPAQAAAIGAAQNAQHFLRCGYTSIIEAGEPYQVGVWVDRFIRAGTMRGPRILPSSRLIAPTGVGLDEIPPWWNLADEMRGLTIFADGPDELVKAVRSELKTGAQSVKVVASGDGRLHGDYHPYFVHRPPDQTTISYEELKAVVEEAHRWDRLVMAHSRALESTKLCLKTGVDIIMHATRLDDESLRLFRERPPLGVSPALYAIRLMNEHWEEKFGVREYFEAARYEEELKMGLESATRLHRMGIRVVPGGDYGNQPIDAWRHGVGYGHELELYVKDAGWTAMEAIVAATREASYLMRMEGKIGTIENGKVADIAVVDGDPLEDISLIQNPRRISAVIKDGEIQAEEGTLHPIHEI